MGLSRWVSPKLWVSRWENCPAMLRGSICVPPPPPLEVLEARVDGAVSNPGCGRCPCLGWVSFKVPSKPNHSIILFCTRSHSAVQPT